MIKVEGLSKKIESKNVLNDIHLTIEKGSITGIVGRNGVGKTTLLRTIAGILYPSSGKVTLNDENIHSTPKVKQDIVFVPDSTYLLWQYNMKEIVKLYKDIYQKFDEAYFYDLLQTFSMKNIGKIGNLSKGQRALFSLILAFSTKANYLLLDEPTDGLDVIVKKEILKFIAGEVADNGVSVVISSHRLDELETLADHIIVLKDGKVESEMEMDQLKQQYKKIQVAYSDGLPEEIQHKVQIFHKSGRVYILLVKADDESILNLLKNHHPLLIEELPMSLEDIFIAKLGGEKYV
jgi:ABC-2 type transport system ATP-binding protein